MTESQPSVQPSSKFYNKATADRTLNIAADYTGHSGFFGESGDAHLNDEIRYCRISKSELSRRCKNLLDLARRNDLGDVECWLPGNKTKKFALRYREKG